MSEAQKLKRVATIEQREDGFYVHLNAFSDTRMVTGRTRRRSVMAPLSIGPFESHGVADSARQDFIQNGSIRIAESSGG